MNVFFLFQNTCIKKSTNNKSRSKHISCHHCNFNLNMTMILVIVMYLYSSYMGHHVQTSPSPSKSLQCYLSVGVFENMSLNIALHISKMVLGSLTSKFHENCILPYLQVILQDIFLWCIHIFNIEIRIPCGTIQHK